MSQMLAGLPGVVCMMDDIFIHGAYKAEHDKRLRKVCSRLEKNGATLNPTKCVVYSTSVKYLGQIIDSEGIRSDPDEVRAITDMPTPLTVQGVRRFLGMVNHVGKFIPPLSSLTEPLRSLLSKKNAWRWDAPQQTAFQKIKDVLSSPPCLAHYSPNAELIVSEDASSVGLGAVLLQRGEDGSLRAVAYASYSLKPAEQR